jgi:hypothetical protein
MFQLGKILFNHLSILWISILTFILIGCGSAEAIKSYGYPIPKVILEKAVMHSIENNSNIYVYPVDTAVKRNAFTYGLVWIKIKVGKIDNDYTFRYRGDSSDWKNSPTSQIMIVAAHNSSGHLDQGQNEHNEFSSKLANDLTSIFETELIAKIDKELNLKHVVKHANED